MSTFGAGRAVWSFVTCPWLCGSLDLKLLLELGLQTRPVYYTMHFSAAKELSHIFLNLIGLCVIVVLTCKGEETFLFHRYSKNRLLGYINLGQVHISLSVCYQHLLDGPNSTAGLHFLQTMHTVYF